MSDIEIRAEEIAGNLRKYEALLPGVDICAVTKTMPASDINAAILAGARFIGENRVQELLDKLPEIKPGARVDLIGRLQTNKVRQIVGKIGLLQSLDRYELALELSKRSAAANVTTDALLQINAGEEPQKGGVAIDELPDFLSAVTPLPGIRVKGLMAVMPIAESPEELRPLFKRLRALFEECARAGYAMEILSMGMTADCVVAAEEGATMVRLGRALFGSRRAL